MFLATPKAFGICQALLFSSFLLDLILCPHSKVEESFQLQATHDLIYFGVRPALWGGSSETPYDHLQYPGVVPRSFTGPCILASICSVIRVVMLPLIDLAHHPMMMQFLSRFCLLTILALSWGRFAEALNKKSRGAGCWLLLITSCQFHMPFYASRMLPNVFALAMVLNCYANWLSGINNVSRAATLLVAATAIFRCDLLLLLGSVGLAWLITKKLSILQALKIGIVTGIISLGLTVPLDSVLWQRPLWPEGEVFYYNVILGKSSNWGTSPWHWYYTSALPKSMLLTILLVPFSFLRIVEYFMALERRFRNNSRSSSAVNSTELFDKQWLEYLLPVLGFVTLYSFLAHKEMRFIFPAIPMLNAMAAVGLQRLYSLASPAKGKERLVVASLAFFCGLFCLLTTLVGSLIFVAVSQKNYPGGDALLRLSDNISNLQLPSGTDLHVHIDVASAMSGVSLFGQRAADAQSKDMNWTFHKSGYEKEHSLEMSGLESFTHILSEDANLSQEFEVIDTVQGNPSFSIRRFRIETTDAIHILERKAWGKQNR